MTRLTTRAPRFIGTSEAGLWVFRRLCYAEAPVGNLRFAPPRSTPLVGEDDARRFSAIAPQDLDSLPRVVPGAENYFYSPAAATPEDCLALNVWTADVHGTAPVLLWIHGGAFLCESGTGAWASGVRALAAAHGTAGGRVFHYDFAWKSGAVNGAVRAAHSVDVPVTFGNLEAGRHRSPRFGGFTPPHARAGLGGQLPVGRVRPLGAWPVFSPDDRATMIIDRRSAVERDRSAGHLDFWDSVALATQRKVGAL